MSGFRKRWGKKGMLDDVSDLIFLFVAAVVLLLLVGFFSVQNQAVKEEKALGEMETKEMERLLLDYLRMPVEGKGTVMDLILAPERDSEALYGVGARFFDESDCVIMVISFLDPEFVATAEPGMVAEPGDINEEKIFYCVDEYEALVLSEVTGEATQKVKLDEKTKVWLEYFPNE